jgi:DNA-binding NtrC family response regulator
MSSVTNGTGARILVVVDDEPDILLALKAVLEGRGHYVKTFDNPSEALSHLTSSSNGIAPYDLVITDYRMPGSGISGLDLAKQVKEYTIKRTKVFLMSGSVNASSLPKEFSEAMQSKIVDEFVQKPIPNDKLIAAVERSFLHNNKDNSLL